MLITAYIFLIAVFAIAETMIPLIQVVLPSVSVLILVAPMAFDCFPCSPW